MPMTSAPAASVAQRRTGQALGSRAVVGVGNQTLLCTYLSAVLLAGLLLNSLLGWCRPTRQRRWSSPPWR